MDLRDWVLAIRQSLIISTEYCALVSFSASSNSLALSLRIFAALEPFFLICNQCLFKLFQRKISFEFLTKSTMFIPRSMASQTRNAALTPTMTFPASLVLLEPTTLPVSIKTSAPIGLYLRPVWAALFADCLATYMKINTYFWVNEEGSNNGLLPRKLYSQQLQGLHFQPEPWLT